MPQIASTPGYPSDYLKSAGETPKIVPVNILFGSSGQAQPFWLFDYSNNQQQAYLKTLQGMWIDNLDNASTVTVNILGNSTQRIVAPANSQGYYTVLVSGAIRLTLSSTGTAVVPVYFSNQPFTTHIWTPNASSSGGGNVTIVGPLPVPVSVSAPNPLPVSFASSNMLPVTQVDIVGTSATAALTGGPAKWFQIQAASSNSANVRWGDGSTTSTRGGVIIQGGSQFFPPVSNNEYTLTSFSVFVATGDTVTVIYVN